MALSERITSPFVSFVAVLRRRGSCLLILALLDLGMSYGLFTLDDYLPAVRASYVGHTAFMPLTGWAFLWGAVGLVDALQAFARYDDRIAFVLSASLKFGWAGGFLVGWLFLGLDRAWLSTLIYVAMGGVVLIISGWQENHSTIIILEDVAEMPDITAGEIS